jgi:hypothetical protein
MNERKFPRLATTAVAMFVAALMFPSVGHAQLPDPRPPVITFDSRGQTHYDSAQQLLSIDASALLIELPMAPPAPIQAATGTAGSPGCNPPSACGTLTIRAKVNNSGILVAGIAGPQLMIVGKVLDPFSGETIADGELLTGDVTGFRVAAGKFELTFSITGGILNEFGSFNQCGLGGVSLCDVGVSVGLTLPDGTLPTVSFASDFDGGAAGNAGAIEPPEEQLPPSIVVVSGNVEVQADGSTGKTLLPLQVHVEINGVIMEPMPAITCSRGPAYPNFDPIVGSFFPNGTTSVMCAATGPAGAWVATGGPFLVTVINTPPALPGGACFVVDFREFTYFRGQAVITSWPYTPGGGVGSTASRGTEYKIYGFQPSELGQRIPNADDTWITYPVEYDDSTTGYFINLGGPARAMICPGQLHNYVLAGKKANGHLDGSTLLPLPQRNVPGIMLTHNTQIVKVPYRVRKELYQLGLYQAPRGVIDYIGLQLQGNGSAEFKEFVDVQVQFAADSLDNRLTHYLYGFHTAINTNFETSAGCNYVDYAPGNDAVRLHDVWGPNRSKWQGYASWQACGSREPAVNQRRRGNYDVPFNAVQILPTVNTSTDTLRLFYGPIRPVLASEMKKKDHKIDWAEWDRWDY